MGTRGSRRGLDRGSAQVTSPQPSSELVGPSEAWSGGMPDGGVGGELGRLGSKTHLNMRDEICAWKMCPSAARRFS